MGKIGINRLVSLIMEEINKVQEPNKPMYFKNLNDVIDYFDLDENPPESEMGEMANKRPTATFEKLDEPMRISLTELDPTSKLKGPIASLDPNTNEIVQGVIIGDEIVKLKSRTREGGLICLKFQNYGAEGGLDRELPPKEFIVLPEKYYSKHEPRSARWGTEYVKPDYSTPVPGETERQKQVREKKPEVNNERYAKYYVINPSINRLFSNPTILNKFDVSLIPEIWAGSLRTERVTNKEVRFSFGGNRPTLNFEYYALQDFEDVTEEDGTVISGVESALNNIFKTRMDLEGLDVNDPDYLKNRLKKRSKTKPREYANYIYQRGGNWDAIQRIYNENEFKNAGEYTDILQLLKKNIQEGKVSLNTKSKLYVDGDVVGNEYILRAKFEAEMNYRTVRTSRGEKITNLIQPVFAEVRADIPQGTDITSMTIRNNKDFFGTPEKPGLFQALMNELGEKIIENLNPDEVLTKLSSIIIPENINREIGAEGF